MESNDEKEFKRGELSNLDRPKITTYVDKLRDRKSFGLSRYGDGEWLTIFEFYGLENSNGCTFTKELGDDLRRVILEQHSYDYTLLRVAMRKMRDRISKWLEEHEVKTTWKLGDFLLRASLDGKLFPLIEQLRNRNVLYVGPDHCKQLDEFFPIVDYVELPRRNAHAIKEQIEARICATLDTGKIDFIGYSSGLAGKVFMGDIWSYTNGEIPFLDFGSMWDGYFGIPSRSYIRRGRVDFDQLREVNFGC